MLKNLNLQSKSGYILFKDFELNYIPLIIEIEGLSKKYWNLLLLCC